MNAIDEILDKAEVRKYEVNLVVSPTIEDKQREDLLNTIRKTITTWGGEVHKTNEDGKKVLAYQIEGHNEAWYYFLDITLPSDKLRDLDAKVKYEDGVIRHLIVKAEK